MIKTDHPKTLNPTKRKEPGLPCKTNPLQWNGSINSEMIAIGDNSIMKKI
jgi:hypothetical protein